MKKFLSVARDLKSDESGATMIEYGLLAGLIGVFMITATGVLGTSLDAIFGRISTELDGVAVAPAG